MILTQVQVGKQLGNASINPHFNGIIPTDICGKQFFPFYNNR